MGRAIVIKNFMAWCEPQWKKYPEPTQEQLAKLVGKPVTLCVPIINPAVTKESTVGSIEHISKESDRTILVTTGLDAAKMDKDFMGIFKPSQVSMSLQGYGDVGDDGIVNDVEYTMASIEPRLRKK